MFNEQINKDVFIKPLQIVSGVIDRKQSLPILSNVLIEKNSSDELKLTATDLDIQISFRIEDQQLTTDVYSTTVSGKTLLDVLKVLPDGSTFSISEISGNRVNIREGKSRFSLQTLPAADFPVTSIEQGELFGIKLQQTTLKQLLGTVQYAMAQQDIRYYLNGVLMVIENSKLKLVATDGHRLAFSETAVDWSAERVEVIIPRKTIVELSKLLSDSNELIQIIGSGQQLRFEFGSISLVSKIIDGKFPDYQRVIPLYDNFLCFNRIGLLKALQRVSILSNDKFHGVRLVLTEKNLCVVSGNSDQEEAQEDIETDYHGEALDIGFNVNYLLDGLSCIESEHVNIYFGGANSSILMKMPGLENYKYVVMPMRI